MLRMFFGRSTHDETPWCMTDEIEWVAGNQRKYRFAGIGDNLYLVGFDHPQRGDPVRPGTFPRVQFNQVTKFDILQAAKEAVTMRGDRHVACCSRRGGTGYQSCATQQNLRAGAGIYGDFKCDAGDAQHGKYRIIRYLPGDRFNT